MDYLMIIKIAAAIIEIVGLIILAKEILLAIEFEELYKEMEFVKQLQYLYTIQDYKGFYLFCRLDQGDTPEEAIKFVDQFTPNQIQNAVIQMWENLNHPSLSIKRFTKMTSIKVVKRRRFLLLMGTFFLIAGTVVHLLL